MTSLSTSLKHFTSPTRAPGQTWTDATIAGEIAGVWLPGCKTKVPSSTERQALLSSRYFYPWPNRFDDLFFVQGDGFRLGCRFRMKDPELPTTIHFHGNGASRPLPFQA